MRVTDEKVVCGRFMGLEHQTYAIVIITGFKRGI